jgi:hypothetical protein
MTQNKMVQPCVGKQQEERAGNESERKDYGKVEARLFIH